MNRVMVRGVLCMVCEQLHFGTERGVFSKNRVDIRGEQGVYTLGWAVVCVCGSGVGVVWGCFLVARGVFGDLHGLCVLGTV